MMRSSKHRLQAILVLIVVAALALPVAVHGANVGVRAGYFFDAEAFSLGMEYLAPVSSSHPAWYLNPNMELIMGDFRDQAALSMDFHYDFETSQNLTFWAGAGPSLFLIDRNRFDDDMEVEPGLNLLLGFGALNGSVRPYVQGKGVIMDNPEAAISVGIRF